MKARFSFWLLAAALSWTFVAVACGGDPSSPSSAGVVLRGTLVGDGPSASALALGNAVSSREVRVTVRERPEMTTTASAGGGTFRLAGLPEGSFTLMFTMGSTTLGSITIAGVAPNQQITITVRVTGQQVVLEDDEREEGEDEHQGPPASPSPSSRSCMINGGRAGDSIELEGSVATGSGTHFTLDVQGNRASHPVEVDASGASFKCNGPRISDAQCRATVVAGAKVHVKGTLQACDASSALARASEVKVQ